VGLFKESLTLRAFKAPASFSPIPSYLNGQPQLMQLNYQAFANEGYGGNEIVFAAIEELATSAAEPQFAARSGSTIVREHRALDILNRPNPFMGRYEMLASVMMFMAIAGNAFVLKVRSGAGRVVQLWVLRPDRVRVVPDAETFIARYDYLIDGSETIPIPVNDLIHFKTRNPLNDFYGMSPLKVIAPRIDTDNYLRQFVLSYLRNMGVPGGILATKRQLSDEALREIKNNFHSEFGDSRVGELMVIDQNEISFTATTAQLGQRGLVVPELDEINEARLAMPFGVPLSLIGARLGMASSSYGNRKADRESFWDETLAPKYKEIASILDLQYVPEFTGIDSIFPDLSDVRALMEDDDKKHARWRADYAAGLVPLETAQDKIGLEASERTGIYIIPLNAVPTPSKVLDAAIASGEQVPPPRLTERTDTPAADPGEPKGVPASTASGNGTHP